MKKCYKTAQWEVEKWSYHSYSEYTFLLEIYFCSLSFFSGFQIPNTNSAFSLVHLFFYIWNAEGNLKDQF